MRIAASVAWRRAGGVLCLVTLACGGAPASPSRAAISGPTETLGSAHFVLHYAAMDAGTVEQTSTRLEAEYDRIIADLEVATMPVVDIYFYPTHAALVAGAGPNAGVIPTWATGLATGVSQVHMLSPSIAGSYDQAVSNLIHEFAHCVSIRVNRTIPNNPRWLWESVAIYESRQLVNPRNLTYLVAGQPPSFARLNTFDNTLVYDVGFLIAEFVVERWGRERLVQLVAANGDVAAVLLMSLGEFETQWFAAVRSKYGI
ncbi:MAG: hypothetical protein ABIS06_09820 [Vicinamibacterales bacterium]